LKLLAKYKRVFSIDLRENQGCIWVGLVRVPSSYCCNLQIIMTLFCRLPWT